MNKPLVAFINNWIPMKFVNVNPEIGDSFSYQFNLINISNVHIDNPRLDSYTFIVLGIGVVVQTGDAMTPIDKHK